MILIADRIHAYHLMMVGKCNSPQEAYAKAQRSGNNIGKMFANRIENTPAVDYCLLAYWEEISQCQDYAQLENRVERAAAEDAEFLDVVEKYGRENLIKLRRPRTPDNEKYERYYLLSEIVMSLYVTEKLGYVNEIWEHPPPFHHIKDPISYLYQNNEPLLLKLIGSGHAARKQHYLDLKSTDGLIAPQLHCQDKQQYICCGRVTNE